MMPMRNPHRSPRPLAARRRRGGFTIVELLISLTVALVVLSAATAFAMTSWESRRGWTLREGVDRNARFIGMAVGRDAAEAGIDIESTPVFGSIGTFADTLSVLSVPYEPLVAPTYRFDAMDTDTINPLPPGGNCGTYCLSFQKQDGTFNLREGDLARLQVGGERRLLLITGTSSLSSDHFSIEFLPVDQILGRPAGLGDSLRIDRFGTAIQKLKAVAYWYDPEKRAVMRSERLSSSTGAPIGEVLADGVDEWAASLIFEGGAEHARYDGADTDSTNDGHRIMAVKVRAKVMAARVDPVVNGGEPVYRWYEWRVAPRNLMYEKNRL
jgi:prepilin-type N-terminal cleavage/methylation domain-containing protein